MQATGLVDQLLDIHRNRHPFRNAADFGAGFSGLAMRAASFSLEGISLSKILIAGSIVARSMADPSV
jgi:hypothetical protein